jgi:hypothetical protein
LNVAIEADHTVLQIAMNELHAKINYFEIEIDKSERSRHDYEKEVKQQLQSIQGQTLPNALALFFAGTQSVATIKGLVRVKP